MGWCRVWRPASVQLPDDAVRALFEASGVIRVDTLGDLFDVALLLTSQPLPPGDRLAVVGNSTALGVLAANAAAADGLRLTRLDDVGVDAGPAEFAAALRDCRATTTPSTPCVAVFVPPLRRSGDERIAEAIRSAAAGSSKPVVSHLPRVRRCAGQLAARGDRRAAARLGAVLPVPRTGGSGTRRGRGVTRSGGSGRRARCPSCPGSTSTAPAHSSTLCWPTRPAGRDLTDEEAGRLLGSCRSRRLLRGAAPTSSRWC